MYIHEVDCIAILRTDGEQEHITHIGHIQNNWRLTKESVIARIESGTDSFYIRAKPGGRRIDIRVERPNDGTARLCAPLSGKQNDALLRLPQCAAACALIH